ncbi:hypothetical protein BDV32DRAFT_126666 [Aspergillus pseudonomiae]|nr:hypothetical protein BDV32DRAFT_126666 [Aspergillus pseudonomiae]
MWLFAILVSVAKAKVLHPRQKTVVQTKVQKPDGDRNGNGDGDWSTRGACDTFNCGRLRYLYSADEGLPNFLLCLDVSGLGWVKLVWAEKDNYTP